MDVVIDVPEEICDLNPQKTCHMATKMVPKLTPERECTQVPQEVCNLSYGRPKVKSRKKANKKFLIKVNTKRQIRTYSSVSNTTGVLNRV